MKQKNSRYRQKPPAMAKLETSCQKIRSIKYWHSALEGVYCIIMALKMIRQCFLTSQRKTWSLQWVNDQLQCCRVEAKFVIFSLFPTPLAFSHFWKNSKWNWTFLAFSDQFNIYVGLADFWALANIWTQNDTFLLQTLDHNFITFSFAVSCFYFCCFKSLLSKTKHFGMFTNWVSFILYMYVLSFKVLCNLWCVSCIYLAFGFFGAFWLLLTVDVAFFTHDNLATLTNLSCSSIQIFVRNATVSW